MAHAMLLKPHMGAWGTPCIHTSVAGQPGGSYHVQPKCPVAQRQPNLSAGAWQPAVLQLCGRRGVGAAGPAAARRTFM